MESQDMLAPPQQMMIPLEIDPSLSPQIRAHVVQHQVMRSLVAQVEGLKAELVAVRSQRDTAYQLVGVVNCQIDAALNSVVASRSWRLTGQVRRLLQIGHEGNPLGDSPDMLPRKVDLLLGMMRSVWWDIAMPVRAISRPLRLLRRIAKSRRRPSG